MIRRPPRNVSIHMSAPHETVTDAWLVRLRAGVDAGYYRTESALAEQEQFPWQGKSCRDCPFWANNLCLVRMAPRAPSAHTCIYFDEPNRGAAQAIIGRRNGDGPWRDDFYDRSGLR